MSQSAGVGGRNRRWGVSAISLVCLSGLLGCGGSSSEAMRLVGSRRVAVEVPADWKTEINGCASTPRMVDFDVPMHGQQAAGGCVVPAGGSVPARDTVSVYVMKASLLDRRRPCCSGEFREPNTPPAGTVHGMLYYVFDSYDTGRIGVVAMTLDVPEIGVAFLVGARDRASAQALLATIQAVPAGTKLR